MQVQLQQRECDGLLSLARYLGQDYNVDVVYNADGKVETRPGKILIPIMSDNKYQEYKEFLRGCIYHEAGHVAHTDLEVYGRLNKRSETIKVSFLNVLDDYRVNLFQKQDYRNAELELNNMYHFNRLKIRDKLQEDEEFKHAILNDPGTILWGIGVAMGEMLEGIDTDYLPKDITDIADKAVDILDEFKQDGIVRDRKKGTRLCLKYAIKIEKLLKDLLEKPPPQEEKEKEEGQNENKLKGKARKKLFGEMKESIPKDTLDITNEEIQTLIFESHKKDMNEHIPHPVALERDIVESPYFDPTSGTKKMYEGIKRNVSQDIASMRSRLFSLLMARKRMHFLPDAEQGEIDMAAIYSLRSGNKRVFERMSVGRRMNTAIEILVDCSGSMRDDGKYHGAKSAAIACTETLEALHIPFEVTGYTTDYDGCRDIDFTEEDNSYYNRFEPLRHFVYKSFEENFSSVKYRLLNIGPNDNNCDPESVMWAAQRLARRKEDRKILIVICDGMPACGYHCDFTLLNQELKKAVKKIKMTGIEVYGIGVYTDEPKQFYPEWDMIKQGTGRIASAIYGCLSRKLMNGRTQY